jgi:DNA-binding NarL/FixJ family response regulator
LREALTLAHRHGNRRRVAYILSAIGALAAAAGDIERAVRLDAIASAAVVEIGANPAQPAYARRVLPARIALRAVRNVDVPPAAPDMTLDQAVDDSLAWLQASERPSETGHVDMPNGRAAELMRSLGLTPREREVVALLARGLTNRQIGQTLVVTEGTAENYVQRVLGKLGVNNRAQVAAWAVEHGLGQATVSVPRGSE